MTIRVPLHVPPLEPKFVRSEFVKITNNARLPQQTSRERINTSSNVQHTLSRSSNVGEILLDRSSLAFSNHQSTRRARQSREKRSNRTPVARDDKKKREKKKKIPVVCFTSTARDKRNKMREAFRRDVLNFVRGSAERTTHEAVTVLWGRFAKRTREDTYIRRRGMARARGNELACSMDGEGSVLRKYRFISEQSQRILRTVYRPTSRRAAPLAFILLAARGEKTDRGNWRTLDRPTVKYSSALRHLSVPRLETLDNVLPLPLSSSLLHLFSYFSGLFGSGRRGLRQGSQG